MNEHLTDQDIIAFVEAADTSPETIQMISKVTTHMVRCESCLERVKAVQRLYGQLPMKDSVKESAKEKGKVREQYEF